MSLLRNCKSESSYITSKKCLSHMWEHQQLVGYSKTVCSICSGNTKYIAFPVKHAIMYPNHICHTEQDKFIFIYFLLLLLFYFCIAYKDV